MRLIRVFYVSAVVGQLSDVDVQSILGASQMRNRRLDVTGMIAQSDGHFAQVLEGRREAVAEVMARVRRDGRHEDIRILLEESISQRQFERWAMGLIRRDDLAAELKAWHRGGPVDAAAAYAVIKRLYPASL